MTNKNEISTDDYRQSLENQIFDAEIQLGELRTEILSLLGEYRYVKWALKSRRAALAHNDFLSGVRDTFGPDVAAIVAEHSQA
jgi:hypothetical protein